MNSFLIVFLILFLYLFWCSELSFKLLQNPEIQGIEYTVLSLKYNDECHKMLLNETADYTK